MTLLAAMPADEAIREKAAEVVQRPDYQYDVEADTELIALFFDWLLWFFEILTSPFRWIHGMSAGLPDVLRWVITISLSLVLIGLLLHMIYSLVATARAPKQAPYKTRDERQRTLQPKELEARADEAVSEGDFIGAVRMLFRAAVLRIEQVEKRKTRPGTTNRELLRKYRSTPLFDGLTLFVETIDHKWYGDDVCTRSDYDACQSAHARLKQIIRDRSDVLSA